MPLTKEIPVNLSEMTGVSYEVPKVLRETGEKIGVVLRIHESDSGESIIGRLESVDGSIEIGRIHLTLAQELKDNSLFYPFRSDVSESFQKQGVGFFLYLMMFYYFQETNRKIISGSLNSMSQGLWNKLKRFGYAQDRTSFMGYKYQMELANKN